MTPQFHVAVADQGLIKDLERQLSETKAEVERLRAALERIADYKHGDTSTMIIARDALTDAKIAPVADR